MFEPCSVSESEAMLALPVQIRRPPRASEFLHPLCCPGALKLAQGQAVPLPSPKQKFVAEGSGSVGATPIVPNQSDQPGVVSTWKEPAVSDGVVVSGIICD